MLTEDQIDELRDLQEQLRAQAEIVSDAWHDWVDSWEGVATALHKYNELLRDARDITGDPMHELGDYETQIDQQELKLDEADAIEAIIEEETADADR